MKKLFILSILSLFFCGLYAQERTVDIGSGLVNTVITKNVAYNGGTSDRLIPTTRDTIDYYVQLSNYDAGHPLHFYFNFTFDTIAGADTTVSVTIMEKKFSSESYSTLIAAATTSAVGSEYQYVRTSLGTINAIDTTGYKYYTSAKPNTLLYYKYLKARLILKGNDITGTGIRVKRVELQFF